MQTIVNADGTTAKTVFTAGSNGSKLELLTVSSTDTSDRDINIFVTRAATNYLISTVKIPLSSGNTNALPAIDIMKSVQIPALTFDANGNKYLYLKSGDTLTVATTTTVTAAKTVTILSQGGDF